MKKVLLLLILFINTSACIDNNETTVSDTLDNADTHHAIPGDKLRFIMIDLNSTLQASKHSDIRNDIKGDGQMKELIKIVEELLLSAEMMSTGFANSKLDKNRQTTFRALAGQLYGETLSLQQVTNNYDYQLIEPTYERLNETCIACHELFRP